MERGYSGLESSVGNYSSQSSSTYEPSGEVASPYRSGSERILADILETNGIKFGYEDKLRVPKEYAGSSSDRIWNPDFTLHETGVIIEYAGMTDDPEYMEGIERKKEIYSAMGLNVVWLYPNDIWEANGDKQYGKVRDDVEENVLSKIEEVIREKESREKNSPYSFALDPKLSYGAAFALALALVV